jgi:hypothetical protein
VDVDIGLRPPRGSHADSRLCGDSGSGNGRIRKELAAGVNLNVVRFPGRRGHAALSAHFALEGLEWLLPSKHYLGFVQENSQRAKVANCLVLFDPGCIHCWPIKAVPMVGKNE